MKRSLLTAFLFAGSLVYAGPVTCIPTTDVLTLNAAGGCTIGAFLYSNFAVQGVSGTFTGGFPRVDIIAAIDDSRVSPNFVESVPLIPMSALARTFTSRIKSMSPTSAWWR